VLRVESAGDVRAISSAGAMGLMQVMPDTWAGLRSRHGLGRDPYDPRDNILAGTAYLREMWDRYGNVAAMLAAYNAGPGRYDEHLATGRTLPAETRAYVATLAPVLGRRLRLMCRRSCRRRHRIGAKPRSSLRKPAAFQRRPNQPSRRRRATVPVRDPAIRSRRTAAYSWPARAMATSHEHGVPRSFGPFPVCSQAGGAWLHSRQEGQKGKERRRAR
jgi:hypothetical protein